MSGLDDAERDRAVTVDVAVEGTQASRASILPTSVWESEEDNRKVAGVCSEALRRLKTTSTAWEGGPVSHTHNFVCALKINPLPSSLPPSLLPSLPP